MNLKTYQAYTMAEALAAVKRDLGSDAVILNTRSFQRGGVLGIGRKTIVEVTATPAKDARPMVEPKPRLGAGGPIKTGTVGAAARRAYGGGAKPQAAGAGTGAAGAADISGVTEEDRIRTRRLAQAMAAKFDQREAESAPVQPRPQSDLPESQSTRSADTYGAPAARRFILTTETPQTDNSPRNGAPKSQTSGEMQDELAAIKTMVGQVLQRQSKNATGPSPTMPAKLFDMYLQLIAQDISEELADTVINEVRDALTTKQLNDSDHVRKAVLDRLATHIPVADEPVPPASADGRPLTIALIGPTGVGKTTTLAKLAATFKLRENRKVGLITSDTYRIAAVDQLRTYANIIGLPLKVALTSAEMRQAVHSLSDCDVILIDTAGRGQNDSARLEELGEFLEAAQAHEVHLVLSSTANEKVLLREAEAFSAVGIHKIVLTKLDEAVSFGMLINVVRKVGKELSFLTTGQEVPTHIEAGRAERLADLILGGEVHA